MPLRLKQLDLHGYKTFATKTEFAFSPGISAIVGPNGSGKSNLVDAVRWVLGEQSFGLLRGKKTEDMIFAGSEMRPRAGMAQATLTFDNADGWLPIDFSEVSITRRAYRDGENEYLLNGQRVRLRDISELLARCGLAERTYTIIGQGLIDTALSLKAEERRALFEEAAGIGVYREKREDALKKLETTGRNLERVLDILAEIKPRLRSLERQAQRARDFNQVKDDLHNLLKLWYGYHWHRAVEDLEQAKVAAVQTATELAITQGQQENFNQEVADVRARTSALRAQLDEARRESARLHGRGEALARELAVADERARSLAAQRESLLAELASLETQAAAQGERLAAAQAAAARLADEAGHAQQQVEASQTVLAEGQVQRAGLLQRESETRAVLARLGAQIAELRAQHTQCLDRCEHLGAVRLSQAAAIEQLQRAGDNARARVRQANEHLNARQADRAWAESQAAAQAETIGAAGGALSAASDKAAAARVDLERLRARYEVLAQVRDGHAGLLSAAQTLRDRQVPTQGTLAQWLRVPPELETAVSAALGAYLDGLVVNDLDDVAAAVAAVGAVSGRAAFLPVSLISAPEPLTVPQDDPNIVGVAARLVTVDLESGLRAAVDLLLGNVVIVRDSAAARRLVRRPSPRPVPVGAKALPDLSSVWGMGLTFVTLDGEVYYAAGPVLAGTEASPGSRPEARERRDVEEALGAAQAEFEQREAERETAARAAAEGREVASRLQAALIEVREAERRATIARDSAGLEAERIAHDLQFRREQLAALDAEMQRLATEAESAQAELSRLAADQRAAEAQSQATGQALAQFSLEDEAAQLARWQTEAALGARAAQDTYTRATEMERARVAATRLLEDRRRRAQQLESEILSLSESTAASRQWERSLWEQVADHESRLGPMESQLAELEARQERVESGDAEARAALHAAERRNAQVQLDFTRQSEELDALRRRIDEDFGLVEYDYGDAASGPTPLPLYQVVEKLEPVEALPEGLEEQLNRKRGQIRRMGLINPDAEREYLEVRERHEFLTAQVDDLQAAQVQLREVIAEMDVLMERDFRTTFDAVANEFRDTFARLFGGGAAKLVLTDPEHLGTTGVDIQARLPGRRPQSLAMLSGGERSLTACALIFALLRVSPTPFCVLDEVDAMLDEANIGRYREMLHELSAFTQFIIVTHNRNTVQAADTVYGMTMGADSASQVIGLKLDGEKVAV